MRGRLIGWLLAGMLGIAHAGSAFAIFHLWRINEIYSNADGTVQFVEMTCIAFDGCHNEERFPNSGVTLTATPSSGATFSFPNATLPSPVLNKTLLIATPGFAAIAGVTPDYTLPVGFIASTSGTITFGPGYHQMIYSGLPTTGGLSKNRDGSTGAATPKNFAGVTGSISAPDTTPNTFSFPAKTGVAPNTPTSSDPISVAGINAPASVSISAGGDFSINSGPFVTTGNVSSGDTVIVRVTSSGNANTTVSTTLNIGGVTGQFQVTTGAAPDTQAPSVPAGVTATSNSANAVRLTWNPSTDNVAVDHYHVFLATQGGIQVGTVLHPATTFHHFGLAGSTLYGYAVNACDGAENCSAQSSPAVSATTAAGGGSSYTAALESGFNLIGNSLGLTLDVTGTFGTLTSPVPGVSDNVLSVWKWNAASGRWAFHTPLLSAADSAAYAAVRNYDALVAIEPGEGYWVNAGTPMSLPLQTGGAPFGWSTFNFTTLAPGFNLIATGSSVTPSQFNVQVSETPPVPGEVPTANLVSLWAWDALFGKWYFYSPILESSGGLPAVKAYADSFNYLHFQDPPGRLLGIGTGFWVNRP